MDASAVRNYAGDLHSLLEESDFTVRKAFLQSFVRKIFVDREKVTVYYKLPLLSDGGLKEKISVLPIDAFGGPKGSFAKPKIETFFELTVGTRNA